MSQQDLAAIQTLIRTECPELTRRWPRRWQLTAYPAESRICGRYIALTRTLKLNARYDAEPLSEALRRDLLDTVLHELLHAHQPWWRQLRDSFRKHPDVAMEAARLTTALWPKLCAGRSNVQLNSPSMNQG